MKLLGNLKRGLVFVISAPAGSGKTTLVSHLEEEFPASISRSVSCTTRKPREGEIHGKDYYFLSHKEFDHHLHQGDFLEHAEVFGNRYGTLKKNIENTLNSGKHVILIIDTQGAHAVRKLIEATFVFVLPPSLETLGHRLKKRNTDSIEEVQMRLSAAHVEINEAIFYDYQIINDDLEVAYDVLRSIFIAKEHEALAKEFKSKSSN